MERAAGLLIEFVELFLQALVDGRGGVALVQQRKHRKFIAADTADDVALAKDARQHLGRIDDQPVAGRMTLRVIDVLQPVQVEEDQQALGMRAARHSPTLLREQQETAPVAQAGQFVRERHLLEFRAEPAKRRLRLPLASNCGRERERHDRRQAR